MGFLSICDPVTGKGFCDSIYVLSLITSLCYVSSILLIGKFFVGAIFEGKCRLDVGITPSGDAARLMIRSAFHTWGLSKSIVICTEGDVFK